MLTQDESMDIVGTLVGVCDVQVGGMPENVILVHDSVSSEDV